MKDSRNLALNSRHLTLSRHTRHACCRHPPETRGERPQCARSGGPEACRKLVGLGCGRRTFGTRSMGGSGERWCGGGGGLEVGRNWGTVPAFGAPEPGSSRLGFGDPKPFGRLQGLNRGLGGGEADGREETPTLASPRFRPPTQPPPPPRRPGPGPPPNSRAHVRPRIS